MAVHQFTLTDVQEAALTEHVADLNVGRQAQGLPIFRSNDEFVGAAVINLLTPVLKNFNAAQLEEIRPLFEQADLATRAQVKADLEGKG